MRPLFRPASLVLVSPVAIPLVVVVALGPGCSTGSAPDDAGRRDDHGVVIDELLASRERIAPGLAITLSWRTRNAVGCELTPGFGAVQRSGSVSTVPAATTTWTLSCSGGGESAVKSVTVEVLGADGGVVDGGSRDAGDADGGVGDDGGDLDAGDADGGVGGDGGDLDAGATDGGADFVTGGDLAEAAAITSFDDLEDALHVWVIREQADVTLAADLPCDLHYPAAYGDTFGVTEPTCTVPAGAKVDSFLVHAPVGGPTTFSGSVTFAREILALQWRGDTIAVGDAVLGLAGVVYGDANERGFGIGISDDVTLADDRRTLTFDITATTIDEVRVLLLSAGEEPPLILSTTLAPHREMGSLVSGAAESSEQAVWLFERTLSLAEDLEVGISAAGEYTGPDLVTPATLSAGTEVASALVHFDPPTSTGDSFIVVSATLPGPVLGLLIGAAALASSDGVVGLADTGYEPSNGRVLELGGDEVWLSGDGRSLRVYMAAAAASADLDELRVVYAP